MSESRTCAQEQGLIACTCHQCIGSSKQIMHTASLKLQWKHSIEVVAQAILVCLGNHPGPIISLKSL
jgi:hypothetical protein